MSACVLICNVGPFLIVVLMGAPLHEESWVLRREDTCVLHPLAIGGTVLCCACRSPGKKVKGGESADGHLLDFTTVYLLLAKNLSRKLCMWEVAGGSGGHNWGFHLSTKKQFSDQGSCNFTNWWLKFGWKFETYINNLTETKRLIYTTK